MILFIKFNAKYFIIGFLGSFEPANKKTPESAVRSSAGMGDTGEAMVATMPKESVCKFSAVS